MPEDRNHFSGPNTLGNDGALIDLSTEDFTVPDNVKGIVVITAGNVVCRPLNASEDITITGAPVGMILPWHCTKIEKTNTTAVLATILY